MEIPISCLAHDMNKQNERKMLKKDFEIKIEDTIE